MTIPKPFLGIDFGTAYSAMAWVDPNTGHADILCNAEGEEKTRSAVFFGNNDEHVGRIAEEFLENEDEAEFVLLGAKGNLVRGSVYELPDGRVITAKDVAVAIFKKLKRDAEDLHFHEPVHRCVVTVPAMFDPLERREIEDVARQAGFETVELLDEPVAAAIAYSQSGQKVGKRVLVYDLGAGTFDAAVLDREEDELKSFRLAFPPEGLRFGGDDLDGLLWKYMLTLADGDAERIRNDTSLSQRMLHGCRRLKENLSRLESHRFSLSLPNHTKFQREVTRAEFEQVVRGRLEETIRLTVRLREMSENSGGAPDTLVLIGGSSRIPLIGQLLSEAVPLVPRSWHRQDVAVALGAAIFADGIWGHKRHRLYRDALKHAKKTGRISVRRLTDLREQLQLSSTEAKDIESTELGSTLEKLVEKSRVDAQDKYATRLKKVCGRITDSTVEQLQREARHLGLTPEEATDVECRILGDSKERLAEQEQVERHRAANELISKAESLRRENKLEEALEQAQLACDSSPGFARAHLEKGQILFDLGKIKLAESAFGVAVDLMPEHRDALFFRGRCRLLLGREQEALSDFDAVISISPSPNALWHRAIALKRTGEPGRAAGDLCKALADRHNFEADCGFSSIAARTVLGMWALRELDDPLMSIEWFLDALRTIRSSRMQSSCDILAAISWFFRELPDETKWQPSDFLVLYAHEANTQVVSVEGAELPSAFGYECPQCSSYDNTGNRLSGQLVLQCKKCGQRFVNSAASHSAPEKPVTHGGKDPLVEDLVGLIQLALWEACYQVDGPGYELPLGRFHAMCAEMDLPVLPLLALENETLGLTAVRILAQASDDDQALVFIDWLIEEFDVDVCKIQADACVKNRPKLMQKLTPRIDVEEDHGWLLNNISVTNLSPFSVHNVRAEAKVTRVDRKTSTITRTIQRLGPGEQHQWENVFPDAGFLGINIKSVVCRVFCREGGKMPAGIAVSGSGICPKCGATLATELAKQCETCGADWH
ncbi:MAG: hypothetical protein KatS3mg105_5175 [Gemmatales bacterium]|nr:MAG: hypothetical protein KatS3mg105_5175 [Gemmatales bacterium]